ncbi:hypothetical protein [Lysinibacillus sp. NPDC059133]|uniref:hypothetical protein n=1 Tax=Lysinibacillus sp. NPDC059133 TaxID=3346737 RepID=UPI0036B2EDBF
MSIQGISSFLNRISKGINVSTGSVYSFLQDFGRKAETYIASISKELLNSQVLYTDAIVVRNDGKNAYIRNQSTEDAVMYMAMKKKDIDRLKEMDVLNKYAGKLVHDPNYRLVYL